MTGRTEASGFDTHGYGTSVLLGKHNSSALRIVDDHILHPVMSVLNPRRCQHSKGDAYSMHRLPVQAERFSPRYALLPVVARIPDLSNLVIVALELGSSMLRWY